jgi:hypothetical protein
MFLSSIRTHAVVASALAPTSFDAPHNVSHWEERSSGTLCSHDQNVSMLQFYMSDQTRVTESAPGRFDAAARREGVQHALSILCFVQQA